jgi:signal transduction histidine kinase
LESTFLVTLLLFFPPLSGWVQNWVGRSLTSEIESFRRLADGIDRSVSSILSTETLKDFVETSLRRALPQLDLRIVRGQDSDTDPGHLLIPLKAGDRQLGGLRIKRDNDEPPGRREGLRILADAVAGALERSRLLERQITLERELSEKSHLADLGRMAASVAHNVKNPLSSIKTLLQLQLEAANQTAAQREELEMMVQEVDRLAATVSNLLRFSRLDLDASRPLPRNKIHLPTLIESLTRVFKGDLETKSQSIRLRLAPGLNTVASNTEALKDILSNLISNSIEASPLGAEIDISAEESKGQLILNIDDQGHGIPPELRKKVLDPFFTTKGSGTGLGLAIVKHRVQQLQGVLNLRERPDSRGMRVEVRLPI